MSSPWLKPLCPEEIELVSLSTGIVAPTDVAKDKMTKQNLKTFSNVNAKKSSGRGTAKELILKAEIN